MHDMYCTFGTITNHCLVLLLNVCMTRRALGCQPLLPAHLFCADLPRALQQLVSLEYPEGPLDIQSHPSGFFNLAQLHHGVSSLLLCHLLQMLLKQ